MLTMDKQDVLIKKNVFINYACMYYPPRGVMCHGFINKRAWQFDDGTTGCTLILIYASYTKIIFITHTYLQTWNGINILFLLTYQYH